MARLEAGFGTAIITPPTPVQLAGFIEDQPATEVHDDLEVRALFLRGEHGGVCLLVCDLLGLSPRVRRTRFATRSPPRSISTARAVLTSCIHTHAGPSTLEGSHLLGWVTPDGYRETLVRAVRRRGASPARPPPRPPRCAPAAGRCRPVCRSTGAGLPYDPTFAVVDVLGDRRNADRHDRERLDPSRRARARVSRGVERLGRAVPHRARAPGRRHRGAAVGRDRRREPVPRPPPGQRLRRRRVRRGRAARPRRRASASTPCSARPKPVAADGPAVVRHRVHRRDARIDAADRRTRRTHRADRAGRVDDRSGAARVDPRRGVPRARPRDRRPRPATERTCCSPASRPSGTATSRRRSATATRSRRATAATPSPRSPTRSPTDGRRDLA